MNKLELEAQIGRCFMEVHSIDAQIANAKKVQRELVGKINEYKEMIANIEKENGKVKEQA